MEVTKEADETRHIGTSERAAAIVKSPEPHKHTGDMIRAQRDEN